MSASQRFPRRRDQARRYIGGKLIKNMFAGLSGAARALPQAKPHRHGVDVIADLPYLDTGMSEHLLDVYRPSGTREPLPIALYIHGGGFRILSKDSHWVFALGLAKAGFLVFTINYRLAPKHPYPAALEDSAAAYEWVLKQAEMFGGDPSRVVIAGESAGANISTALTIASCYEREEEWAKKVYALNSVPVACSPLCGVLEVGNVDRLLTPEVGRIIADRVIDVSEGYLQDDRPEATKEYLQFADPLVILEEGKKPDRPLPPFFASIGQADLLLEDTRRLKRALDNLDVRCEAPEYPGEPHAFQALLFRKNARLSWEAWLAFLNDVLGEGTLIPASTDS